MESLTIEASETLSPEIWRDFRSAIFSQALACGLLLRDSSDGRTIASYGQEARPANRSRARAKEKVTPIHGTYGPTFFDSSVPIGPLSSWESKSRQRLARVGSTECNLIWRVKDTPAGVSLSQLVPSMRRIEETDSGLWPTAVANDAQKRGRVSIRPGKSNGLAAIAKSTAADASKALWPTAVASMAERGGRGDLLTVARGYQTAHAGTLCPTAVASPNENRNTRSAPSHGKGRGATLAGVSADTHKAAMATLGPTQPPSPARTVGSGVLNPEFVCWLMGVPSTWLTLSRPSATESSRKSRRKSSRRISSATTEPC